MLPFMQMDLTSYAILRDPDVWYNFRQIEVMVSNFPSYTWFDPMTAYPYGKYIDWGPVFPFLASVLCLLTGASQRVEMIFISSLTPVLISLVMIPIVFIISRILSGWKAGIIAAIFITVISGHYFYRSSFGVADHHIAEVLFASLFCLFFLYAIKDRGAHRIDFRRPDTLVPVAIPSFLAGLSLAVGLMVVPTVLLFAVILGVYSIIQVLWDGVRKRSSEDLLLVNSIVILCSLSGLALIGIRSPVYSLTSYSMAPVHMLVVLLGATFFLYFYSLVARKKPLLFLGLVVLTVLIGYFGAVAVSPELVPSTISMVQLILGNTYETFSITELEPWSLAGAWEYFNIGIIMSIAGFIVFSVAFLRRNCEVHLFALVWGAVAVLATIRYSRFEYFSAVIVAIFSACFLGVLLVEENAPEIGKRKKPLSVVVQGKRDKISGSISGWEKVNELLLRRKGIILVSACIIIFCGMSLFSDYSIATAGTKASQIPSSWVDTLEWVEQSTPDPGVLYLGPYSPDGWQYPAGAYGILSSWDCGHWITFLGKRIPVTNPFQDNVLAGYSFFFTESEDTASTIADSLGARYIIVDWKMVDTKFQPTIPLYNVTLVNHYYFETYLFPGLEGVSESTPVSFVSQPFYRTMVSRLYNFDGSLSRPGNVLYVEYSLPQSGQTHAVISAAEQMHYESARERILRFNAAHIPDRRAAIHGGVLTSPIENVSALRHYRLVFESAEQDQVDAPDFSRSVKVFEFVKGARLSGEGVIEVGVETNLGRVFTYRQESENGYFILPYPTSGGRYPVHTLGPYRIAGSGRAVDVSEEDVIEGNSIG